MEKFENKDYCKNCGGYCCRKSGCDYWVEDFNDKSMKGLLEILSTGDVSIVSFLSLKKLPNGKKIAEPFLYLRARNTDRDIVDLLSIKTPCSLLTSEGCPLDLEHRPSGAANIIPGKSKYECRPNENPLNKILEWDSYQKPLRRIVKKYTGLSVEDKLREDVENLFLDVMNGELDKALMEEYHDIKGLLPEMMEIYPDEHQNAVRRYFADEKVIRKTKQSL